MKKRVLYLHGLESSNVCSKVDFLKSLIAIVNNSPTLRRIIEDKVNMVVGDGFIPMKGKSNTLLTTSMNFASSNSSATTS